MASPPATKLRSLNLRLDMTLMDEVKHRASTNKKSANRFVIDAIQAALKAERDREWREGFEAMGRDPDTNNVDFMFAAASEVVLGDK